MWTNTPKTNYGRFIKFYILLLCHIYVCKNFKRLELLMQIGSRTSGCFAQVAEHLCRAYQNHQMRHQTSEVLSETNCCGVVNLNFDFRIKIRTSTMYFR